MLKKLIKYDFRSCWKKFWPVWAALIILSAINGFTFVFCEKTGNYGFAADVLPKMILGIFCVSAFVFAVIYIEEEFGKGLLGREGYLRFTLPATTTELIASKAITALILEAISGVVVLICAGLIVLIATPETMRCLIEEVGNVLMIGDGIGLILLFGFSLLILAITTAMAFNFHIYLPLSIGHLTQKNRSLLAIATWIGLCVLSIVLLVNVVIPLATKSVEIVMPDYTWKTEILLSTAVVGIVIGCELIYSAIMFFAVKFILEKKLNLE